MIGCINPVKIGVDSNVAIGYDACGATVYQSRENRCRFQHTTRRKISGWKYRINPVKIGVDSNKLHIAIPLYSIEYQSPEKRGRFQLRITPGRNQTIPSINPVKIGVDSNWSPRQNCERLYVSIP